MTHAEAEILRLENEIKDDLRRLSYLGDEYLSKVQRQVITYKQQQIKKLKGER